MKIIKKAIDYTKVDETFAVKSKFRSWNKMSCACY